MDAMRLLGSLLGNNATSSGLSGQILGQLANSLGGGARGGGFGSTSSAGFPLGGGGGGGLGLGMSSSGGANLGGLIGMAITALQQFAQRNPLASGSQSPLAGLMGSLGLAQGSGFPGAGFAAEPAAPQADQQALVLIRAMINAAKADGQIDEQEKHNITSKLADVGPDELAFIREEMAKPMNMDFVREVDPASGAEVYAVSLMAINLDTAEELSYMQQLAQNLGLDSQTINDIHAQLGLAPLYAA